MPSIFGPFNPFKHNAESGEFNDLSKAYKDNPSIELYLEFRTKYPNALIEVSTGWQMDWLCTNSRLLESFDIDPQKFAGCLDADDESISSVCLAIIKNLVLRREYEKLGNVHVQSRDEIMSDALINYMISMMLDAMDWNDYLHIPRDLIVLIKHQFKADVSAVAKKQEVHEKRSNATWMVAQFRARGEKCSIRDVAKTMGVSPSTVLRWYDGTSFEEEVERIEEIFTSGFFDSVLDSRRKFLEEK